MEVIPAIDLRKGKCVRLYQGDYDKETVFSDDPVSTALRWQSEGAVRLHVVDLDGAAVGQPGNLDAIGRILEAVELPVQVGGGIRDLKTVEQLLAMGVGRVVMGTLAVENPDVAAQACAEFGEQVVIGIDARDGLVATRGWLEESTVMATDLAARMVGLGARRIIYTDISRDGTLTSPNFEGVADLVSRVSAPIVAAGGISSVEHLSKLAALGAEGAIVGLAIYTGDLKLADAIAKVS